MANEEEKSTLREEIMRMNENIEEIAKKKTSKGFRFPWTARVSNKKVKDGWASVMYIQENKGIRFLRVPIKEGTVMINDTPHIATPEYIMTYKNKPFLIVPSWSSFPYSPKKGMEYAVTENTRTAGWRLLLNALKSEQLKLKKQISIGTILIIIALGAAAVWFLNQGGF